MVENVFKCHSYKDYFVLTYGYGYLFGTFTSLVVGSYMDNKVMWGKQKTNLRNNTLCKCFFFPSETS